MGHKRKYGKYFEAGRSRLRLISDWLNAVGFFPVEDVQGMFWIVLEQILESVKVRHDSLILNMLYVILHSKHLKIAKNRKKVAKILKKSRKES